MDERALLVAWTANQVVLTTHNVGEKPKQRRSAARRRQWSASESGVEDARYTTTIECACNGPWQSMARAG